MKEQKTTNILLLLIALPIVFYTLKTLSFIFIPLVLSMFIALFFLPIMRWMNKRKVPKTVGIIVIVLLISGILKIGGELIQLSTQEILSADKSLFDNVQNKLIDLIFSIEQFFGITSTDGNILWSYFQKIVPSGSLAPTLDFIGNTLSVTLMTIFFSVLWLSESLNFHKILNKTILKQKHTSIKVFRQIEKDLIKFIIVKVLISIVTGVLFTVACLSFDVSFPVFWGLYAFLVNFIQMVGSFIAAGTVSLFALAEMEPSGILLLFVLTLIAIQGLMGGILEPVFMGKSFSVNVISILIMLMFWGFIWGIPGMIMSIPITVFLKIILEQFESTKIIAMLLSGSDKKTFRFTKNESST
ncbi:MAG: AI-2E family transporter [Bacteroidales bacterium]|nr:AI-2E family transporter [Bacteroidales bacterium]